MEIDSVLHKEKVTRLPVALTIAGSDSSGGAGIQADIKTMTMHNVYAMSVITALTAQNTLGVREILDSTPLFLRAQLDAVFEDIFPDSVKIGMVPSGELICVIAERLQHYNAKNIVVDPVMVATSGASLIQNEAVQTLADKLFSLASLITPNIPEAQVLSEMKISDSADMERAARCIWEQYGCNVLLKGGHRINDANDLLYENGNCTWFYGTRIKTKNTHGTGCTLSSAIASNLAKGFSLQQSVQYAKEYLSGALSSDLDLGCGSGPLNHSFILNQY